MIHRRLRRLLNTIYHQFLSCGRFYLTPSTVHAEGFLVLFVVLDPHNSQILCNQFHKLPQLNFSYCSCWSFAVCINCFRCLTLLCSSLSGIFISCCLKLVNIFSPPYMIKLDTMGTRQAINEQYWKKRWEIPETLVSPRTVYPCRLKKVFSLKFLIDYLDR